LLTLGPVETTRSAAALAILGGTGDQGFALALRFVAAGRSVVIGSRVPERALSAAAEIRALVPNASINGCENPQACEQAGIVILSVPFEHTVSTLKAIHQTLVPGQIVISMGVPLASAIGDGALRMLGVWQGSCAELVASLTPEGVHVISAFQNVSAHRLRALERPVECDVVVSGAPVEARRTVIDLCKLIPGLRGVDGGPLANARIVESITALLIGLNVRYQVAEGIGLRFTGMSD